MRRNDVSRPVANRPRGAESRPRGVAAPAPSTIETSRNPARPAELGADVAVPLLQAVITGGLLAGLVVFVLWELAPDLEGEPVKVWAGLALGISAAAWLVLLGQHRRLLWTIERVVGLDLDRDGATGKPGERLVLVNAEAAAGDAQQAESAARASEFAQFVAALPAHGTSLRAWERRIGRERYTHYRDTLIRVGWARWLSVDQDGRPNERQGWALAVPVETILKRLSG